jgi:hypothetical protein
MPMLPDNPVNEYWLRATEWLNWPTFISQPVVPILFIFYPWYSVIGGIFLLDVLWAGIRYKYVSPGAARMAVPFVTFCKWPAAIGSGIYLLAHHTYFAGVLALAWPLVCSIVMVPGKIGVMQRLFMRKVGLESLLSPRENPPNAETSLD